MLCPKCNYGLPNTFFTKVAIDEVVNCPKCSVPLRVDMGKFKRDMLLTLLIGSITGGPAIFFCLILGLDYGHRTEALIVGVAVFVLMVTNIITYLRYKYSFKLA